MERSPVTVGAEILYSERRVEAKIYSRTNTFSDHRLERSKDGSNCARSSEQQNILALGWFLIPKTFVQSDRKPCHCKTLFCWTQSTTSGEPFFLSIGENNFNTLCGQSHSHFPGSGPTSDKGLGTRLANETGFWSGWKKWFWSCYIKPKSGDHFKGY